MLLNKFDNLFAIFVKIVPGCRQISCSALPLQQNYWVQFEQICRQSSVVAQWPIGDSELMPKPFKVLLLLSRPALIAQMLEPFYQLPTLGRLVPRDPHVAGVVFPATAPGDPKDIVHIFVIGDARRHFHVECERCWQIMGNVATARHELV